MGTPWLKGTGGKRGQVRPLAATRSINTAVAHTALLTLLKAMLHLISWQEEKSPNATTASPRNPTRNKRPAARVPSLRRIARSQKKASQLAQVLTQNMAQAETEVPGSEAV